MNKLTRISNFIGKTFAFRAALHAAVVFYFPETFKWATSHIPLFSSIIMLGMGLTLTPSDFKVIGRHPKVVVIGVVSQFVIMPLTVYSLAVGLNSSAEIAVGVILVGSYPGGVASSVITYLARGNATLSVAVTSATMLLTPIMTPFIFWALAHQQLEISAVGMLVPIMKMVLLPIILGVITHILFRRQTEKAAGASPLVSVVAIVLIIGVVIGASKPKIIESSLLIFGVVVLHNCVGYLLGSLVAKLCKLPCDAQKTLAVEAGMQNSGLGMALASAYFTPLMAVPSTLLSVWYNIPGSLLASYWVSKVEEADPAER